MPIACGIPKNIHSNYSVCCSQLETTRFLSEGDLCTKQLDKKIPDDNEFDNCVLISDAPPEDLQPPVPKSMDEDEIDANSDTSAQGSARDISMERTEENTRPLSMGDVSLWKVEYLKTILMIIARLFRLIGKRYASYTC